MLCTWNRNWRSEHRETNSIQKVAGLCCSIPRAQGKTDWNINQQNRGDNTPKATCTYIQPLSLISTSGKTSSQTLRQSWNTGPANFSTTLIQIDLRVGSVAYKLQLFITINLSFTSSTILQTLCKINDDWQREHRLSTDLTCTDNLNLQVHKKVIIWKSFKSYTPRVWSDHSEFCGVLWAGRIWWLKEQARWFECCNQCVCIIPAVAV